MRLFILLACVVCLSACQNPPLGKPVFHAEGKPRKLSDWNVLAVRDAHLKLTEQTIPYDLNSALFSDYAHKLRTVWIPENTVASFQVTNTFDFPIGTIISKTFYYPTPKNNHNNPLTVLKLFDDTANQILGGLNLNQFRLIETRLLVHRNHGWDALSYVWNDDQRDAVLKRTGDIKNLTLVDHNNNKTDFAYVVPNENQCAGCHATNATTRKIKPIGPKARHLNKLYQYADGKRNQLSAWVSRGVLTGLPNTAMISANAKWSDQQATLDDRARAYLDINCSHCHNKVGPADTSGLYLEPADEAGPNLGICKPPIAAGTGTGDREFGIVPGKPEESIMSYRLHSTDPAVMMPELGRSLSHREGVALIDDWISSLNGNCQ